VPPLPRPVLAPLVHMPERRGAEARQTLRHFADHEDLPFLQEVTGNTDIGSDEPRSATLEEDLTEPDFAWNPLTLAISDGLRGKYRFRLRLAMLYPEAYPRKQVDRHSEGFVLLRET
jgi:hypothetical protein